MDLGHCNEYEVNDTFGINSESPSLDLLHLLHAPHMFDQPMHLVSAHLILVSYRWMCPNLLKIYMINVILMYLHLRQEDTIFHSLSFSLKCFFVEGNIRFCARLVSLMEWPQYWAKALFILHIQKVFTINLTRKSLVIICGCISLFHLRTVGLLSKGGRQLISHSPPKCLKLSGMTPGYY